MLGGMSRSYEHLERDLNQCVQLCVEKLVEIEAVQFLKDDYRNFLDRKPFLISEQVQYTIGLSEKLEKIEGNDLFVQLISDAFNRSMFNLIEKCELDASRMNEHYKGVGSRYYDEVTRVIKSYVPSS